MAAALESIVNVFALRNWKKGIRWLLRMTAVTPVTVGLTSS